MFLTGSEVFGRPSFSLAFGFGFLWQVFGLRTFAFVRLKGFARPFVRAQADGSRQVSEEERSDGEPHT